MRTFVPPALLTFAVVLSMSAPAPADGGVPIPGIRNALVTHRITTREPFPDHVFVLCDQERPHSARFVTVEPGHPLLIEFHGTEAGANPPAERLSGWWANLLVVPRADLPTGRAIEVAAHVVAGHVPTARWHKFCRRGGAPVWAGDRITIDYEIRRVGGDRLEVVRTTRDDTFACCCVAPVLACVGTFLGGLHLLRLSLRPGSGPKPRPRVTRS